MKHYDPAHFGMHDPDDMAYRSPYWTAIDAIVWIGIPAALFCYYMIWKAAMAILSFFWPVMGL